MNGVIWSKMQKTFVPISSVPMYAMLQQERHRQSRALETYNFQMQNLTVTSFKEQYYFDFYDNNTKVTGLCGEMWNLLSKLLNFTLQPMRVNVDGMGVQDENGTYKDGLLGIISRNETIAIPRVDMFAERIIALDFTLPFGINRNMNILAIWNKDKYKNTSFNEHLFYNFGNLCNQTFGAVLFIYIKKNVYVPPFNSFTSLLTNTKYSVISLKSSTGAMTFKAHSDPRIIQAREAKRLIIISNIEKMEQLACFSKKKKYAIYQGEDYYKKRKHAACNLMPTGKPLVKIWAASGIVKNFKYKRTVDLGILKLREVGLIDVLKNRWLEQGSDEHNCNDNIPQPIELYQVSLVIAVLCCGIIIAFIIFIIEKIVFVYKIKQL
ncbi:LOW QUALITY PROTEIN: uncharacterized protein LOC114946004 [Nylanderia fulva]|uniref:LOW QUALITY PROTEIN: uncharacterized protein LOC114946004 n=1 Tax=Nylanderia fulva TaxID=613905 RepID=UPI0010FB5F4D|nr:LOW QUALITY PROTEIN: uncharacterized protein LOC114946004 [Nylanderia fulva]